jgi:hypothetical protein
MIVFLRLSIIDDVERMLYVARKLVGMRILSHTREDNFDIELRNKTSTPNSHRCELKSLKVIRAQD